MTYKHNIIAPKGVYSCGFPGEEYDQALMSTKFPNTRGSSLTNSLRNVIDSSMNFTEYPLNMLFDIKGKDQIMKLIEPCRIENNWGSSSFFDNTMREIVFMNYLLTQRKIIVEDNINSLRVLSKKDKLPQLFSIRQCSISFIIRSVSLL